jgi:hypothetical protein
MMKRRLFCSIASVTVFSGCATSGPLFSDVRPPDPGKAAVYVYRPYAFAGSLVPQDVTTNGEQETPLPLGGFVRLQVAPGRVVVANTGSVVIRHEIAFVVATGDVVFIRYTVSQKPFPGAKRGGQMDSAWMGFEFVPYEAAIRELRELRQSNPGLR